MVDYKEVAEIIKTEKDFDNTPVDLACGVIAKRLADYFEKEAEEQCFRKSKEKYGVEQTSKLEIEQIFNRKQFLKDCGVVE